MIQKTLVTIFIFVVLVVAVYLFGLPQYQQVQSLSSQVKIKKLEVQEKEQYFDDLQSASDKLNNYGAKLAKIDAALPPEPNIPGLFNFLQQEISQNGLILKNLTLDGVSPLGQSSDIQQIGFSLSLSGSYESFKNFLNSLRQNSRIFEVESIALTPPSKGDIFSFDIKIRTHSY